MKLTPTLLFKFSYNSSLRIKTKCTSQGRFQHSHLPTKLKFIPNSN